MMQPEWKEARRFEDIKQIRSLPKPVVAMAAGYMTDEAKEGRDAFKEKRKPEFKKFPRRP